MFGGPRLVDETWVDYVQRTTHRIERKMQEPGYKDWVTSVRLRKWRLAGKTANCCDDRWNKRLFHWKPTWGRGRNVGRPCTRWTDQFVQIAGENFDDVAQDRELWTLLSLSC